MVIIKMITTKTEGENYGSNINMVLFIRAS